MKVGIVTITSGLNYGNSLQNLGLIFFLKELGINAETILNEYDSSHIKRKLDRKIKNFIKKKTNILGKRKKTIFDETRQDKYLSFDKKYIQFSKKHIKHNEITDEIINEYDFFIAGSDIIWNNVYKSDVMFLKNVPSEKKIAYAASFGSDYLPKSSYVEYKEALKDFKEISVREKDGGKIIFKLLNRNVDVCIDPTMLISDERWREIACKPKWFSKLRYSKYIITYFLGNTPIYVLDDIYRRFGKDVKIINLLDKDNIDWYTVDPLEFLYLIDNAMLVYTDSFHGCVFSIIFKTPFFVFSRKELTDNNFNKLTSRITNITEKFNMKSRFIIQDKFDDIIWNDIDFSSNNHILSLEKNKAKKFLVNALQLEKH